jgi:hypothetical protein
MRRYVFRLAILSLAALSTSAVRGDDQQIAQQIIEKLQAEKQAGTLKGFSIDLQVDEGTVWLSGRVANEQQQARALDLARRVTGVTQVVNDLSIAPPPSKMAAKPAPQSVAARPVAPPVEIAPEYSEPAAPAPARKPSNNSILNNVSKTLLGAVHGSSRQSQSQPAEVPMPRPAPAPTPAQPIAVEAVPIEAAPAAIAYEPEPQQPAPLHPVTVRQDVTAASGTGAIGSGVDSTRRSSVVQAAQPVAGAGQQVATADSLQPLNPAQANPQMTAMVPVQVPYMVPVYAGSQMQVPLAMGAARPVSYGGPVMGAPVGVNGPAGAGGAPVPMYMPGSGVGIAPARYDHPTMPGYAWPSYAAYPNYAAVTYPKQYSPTAWPYIGPFYPYPQVPLGWRKVTLEWDDGWWMLDFKDRRTMYNH